MHKEVDVVAFAVELDQLGFEVGADGAHDFPAASKDLVGERSTPVLGREDQVRVKGVDDRITPADVGVWFPVW